MKALHIQVSKAETESILKLLDKENKGYLDFKTFSTVMKPTMSTQINIPRNETHFPNLAPSKSMTNELIMRSSLLKESIQEARRELAPENEKHGN